MGIPIKEIEKCDYCGKYTKIIAECSKNYGFKSCIKVGVTGIMNGTRPARKVYLTRLCKACAKKCKRCGKHFCPDHIKDHKCT